ASANDHRIDEIVVETYSTVQVLAKLQEAPHVTGVGLNALLAKHDIASAPTDLTHTLDSLCVDAIERRASDLHIEIGADMVETRIQYRVGNNLLFRATLSPLLATRLTTLIRERCGIDTSNTDAPHEGAFTFKNHGRPIEARVAIMPTRSGQSITIRLADTRSFQTLDDILGNFPELAERLKADIPVGTRTAYLKIIAGPMNQGKSTTYRALMMEHPRERIKILEVGDPVEQPIPLTTQTNVNRHPNIGLDHTVFLEHALRHDADVVSISEIRDEKTAPELLRFVESGHGGYTTLHTDNALDAIPRFFSLIPKQRSQAADIFGRYVHWILHQRLVPTPCPHCSSTISTTKLDPNVCALLGVSEHKDVISLSDDGCSECSGQSERGRTLAPEVIWVKRSARNAFARKLSQIVLGQIDADYSTILEIDGIELIPRRDFLLALMSQKEIAWQTAYSELRREADHD
ncbi:ATPase, T2SS/T4P/T4SS family, partial [Roseibium sp.]